RLSRELLKGFREGRRLAILQEARRKKGRLLSIPWHADKARRFGERYWLDLSISYGGEVSTTD
ncbi:hypothetical protein RZS08_49710, partial [Arthrospira platensis SPKY1]|nr:hypothetical protein [Arthrospira platensis SPKY1]